MNDDLILLASAYLDGDVTADERARVETDADLLAEVERLRSVRIVLADVEPPSISVREQHLATALDAWDTVIATAVVSAPTPLGDRRRRRSNRVLLGAAAAIMVVFAGGVALQIVTSDSTSNTSSSDAAATAVSTPGEPAAALAESSAAADATRTADGPPVGAAVQGDTESAVVPDVTGIDTGIDDPAPPGDLQLEQLSTPEELGIFASDAVGAPTDPDVPAATSAPIDDLLTNTQAALLEADWPLCLGVDFVVGPALYQDVEVVVGVDTSRDLALAYRAANCSEVARSRLP